MARTKEEIQREIESTKFFLEVSRKSDQEIRDAYALSGLSAWGNDNVASRDVKKYEAQLTSLQEELRGRKKATSNAPSPKRPETYTKEYIYNDLLNKYRKLKGPRKSASTASDFRTLANKFRNLGEYSESRQLADECEKKANILSEQEQQKQHNIEAAKDAAYKKLMQYKVGLEAKEKYYVDDFLELAEKFQLFGPKYKDAAILAEECEKWCLELEYINALTEIRRLV